MSRIGRHIKKEKMISWYENKFPTLDLIVNIFTFLVCTVSPLLVEICEKGIEHLNGIYIAICICAISILVYQIVTFCLKNKYKKKYAYYRKSDAVSMSTLCALRGANAAKHRSIMQSTYGNVPYWHSINYIENILVYDVHEQIRSILFGLQKLVVEISDNLTEDQVTVDLVYCYPEESGYDGELPIKRKIHSQTVYPGNDGKSEWRLITAGNHSLGGCMQSFLENNASFFVHVDQCGYSFNNDKMDCVNEGRYVLTEKDKESGKKGSIVGLKIELKNDEPEAVFVKAILTITTYGHKILEDRDFSEKDFQEIFKEKVLGCYRSLFLSELAQMYIRHAIRDGLMCPMTGETLKQGKKERYSACPEKACELCKLCLKEYRKHGMPFTGTDRRLHHERRAISARLCRGQNRMR